MKLSTGSLAINAARPPRVIEVVVSHQQIVDPGHTQQSSCRCDPVGTGWQRLCWRLSRWTGTTKPRRPTRVNKQRLALGGHEQYRCAALDVHRRYPQVWRVFRGTALRSDERHGQHDPADREQDGLFFKELRPYGKHEAMITPLTGRARPEILIPLDPAIWYFEPMATDLETLRADVEKYLGEAQVTAFHGFTGPSDLPTVYWDIRREPDLPGFCEYRAETRREDHRG